MFDFDRRLSGQLRSGAERIAVESGDVRSVMRRGRRRQRRRQATLAGTAFVAGAGLVTGVLALDTHHGSPMTVQLEPGATAPAGSSVDLSWRAVPATSGLAAAISLSDSGGDLYAVSTAPGVSADPNAQSVLYRSTDGVTWESVPASGDGSTPVADVDASSGVLYAVGTGPANAAIGGPQSVRVSASRDRGATFDGQDLPMDLTAPAHTLQVDGITPEVAAGPHGVVVAVGPQVSFDLVAARPAAASATAWAATPTGIEVLGPERPTACGAGQQISPPGGTGSVDKAAIAAKMAAAARTAASGRGAGASGSSLPPAAAIAVKRAALATQGTSPPKSNGPYQVSSVPCYSPTGDNGPVRYITAADAYPVTATYTWGDLGVSSQVALALQSRPLAFYSADGSRFHEVALPASMQGYGLRLTSGADGFAIVTDNGAVRSVDGQTWSDTVALPSTVDNIEGAGYVDGRLTVVADTGKGASAFVLDGTAWASSPVAVNPMSVSFGPLGVAAVGFASSDGSSSVWKVAFSADGSHWSADSLNTLSGGAVGQAVVAVGPSTVAVTVTRPPTSGEVPPTTPAAQVAVIGTPAH